MRFVDAMVVLGACVALGCGGVAVTDNDAGPAVDAAAACVVTEYGCSFCVPDAAAGACGNIGRYVDGGAVELGCCVGATPYCVSGACAAATP